MLYTYNVQEFTAMMLVIFRIQSGRLLVVGRCLLVMIHGSFLVLRILGAILVVQREAS
jgi:hypothetical protein